MTPDNRAPTALAIPSRVSGTLAQPFAVALYKFTVQTKANVEINLYAQRKVPASDVDTRVSLYGVTGSKYLITNDDPPGQTDSLIADELEAGEYLLAVENVNEAATDLSFEVEVTLP